jgi:hypothetical protein
VQNSIEFSKIIVDSFSISNYLSDNLFGYFILSANFEATQYKQLLLSVNYFKTPNPKTFTNARSFFNIFTLDSLFLNAETGGLHLANSIILKTLKAATLKLFIVSGFNYSFEYVFMVKSLEYSYIGFVLSLFFYVLSFFFLFMLWFTFLTPTPQQLYANENFLFSLDSSYGLVEAEKEVGALDDILMPLFFTLLASIVWFYLLLPLQVFSSVNAYLDSFLLLLFCCIIVSLPLNLLYECGFFFSTFFRGSAGSTSTLMELVYDLIANTTMFARMQVQHVRVLLGLAMYIETTNYIETLSFNQLLDFNVNSNFNTFFITSEHFTKNGVSFVSDMILQVSTLIGELGHYIVFLLQSSASYASLIF